MLTLVISEIFSRVAASRISTYRDPDTRTFLETYGQTRARGFRQAGTGKETLAQRGNLHHQPSTINFLHAGPVSAQRPHCSKPVILPITANEKAYILSSAAVHALDRVFAARRRRNRMSIDLTSLAERLERDEALRLKYLCPLQSADEENVRYEERIGDLLDVAVETDRLFVRYNSQVIWIKPEEVIGLIEESL